VASAEAGIERKTGVLARMWKLSPTDLLGFKGAGGERFAHFVDRLIRAEAAKGSLPQSDVLAQLRVNIQDGGVDTQVTNAIPRDSTGWFGVPTCWQFKAMESASINAGPEKRTNRAAKLKDAKKVSEAPKSKSETLNDLQREIRKPHVEKLLNEGYGFRF
jgi:hypothetical protein